ncbi:hypothetical protein F4778DRAFT_679685 [Xylariomycetidae sp. FL2044]|nr:hypothetical protein F4778DRAFT_679685 [Xylariomycetidae sp. FL2044]
MLNDGGGVIFIDEAYQLTLGNSYGGAGVLDYLLPEVENLTGKIVFVLAGYNKQMESFFAHNPGLPSRFPIEMKFADYTDDELLRILGLKISKQYQGSMKCADGLQGLYCRIISRRIGRGRGREGFGNARTVENVFARITQAQAKRLTRERRAVKQAVKSLVDSVEQNYERELAEQPPIEYSLNKVFLGNPGTGKTTVAKLYGQILVDLGLLSKGEVVVKNPSDFVGSALGQSEQQTKGILAATAGKVLVIDEAYGLYGGGTGGTQGSVSDPYKTAVIDTIVAEVQSVPGDDRCVLLLGYKDQMETMFQNVNPGLSRRFPIASAFEFADFSSDELLVIIESKLKNQAFEATGQARKVAMEMLERGRNRPNFGNAGDIDNLLDAAKALHQSRFSRGETKSAATLDAIDFDENFDRAEKSETNIRMLFQGTVGSEDTIALLTGYQDTVRTMKSLDMDPRENIPFNFLFRGPPGTGKTTTARKMGKVFYDMGFLASAELIECSATDLIGQFVGQTGPKVQKLLDKALGKVLFIDEAYRLADGGFATEAVNELVDSVTKERYHKRLVIILAGYEKDINRLMSVNEGLTSRFPEVINFRGLAPSECFTLLMKQLTAQKKQLELKKVTLDLTALSSPSNSFTDRTASLFSELSRQSSWASARDVQTLGKHIFNEAIKTKGALSSKHLVVDEHMVISHMQRLFDERASRSQQAGADTPKSQLEMMASALNAHAAPRPSIDISTRTKTEQPPPPAQPEPQTAPRTEKPTQDTTRQQPPRRHDDAQRDAGVSDAVWEQLQRDRRAEREREDEYQQLLEAREKASAAERDRIVLRLLEEERRRKEEAEMRSKLAQMGVCPVGFQWIKQAAGYRCAGGSHFMSSEQLRARRSDILEDMGASLLVTPPSLRVFAQLGILDHYYTVSNSIKGQIVFGTDARFQRRSIGLRTVKPSHGEYVQVSHRADLVKVLYDTLSEKAKSSLFTNKAVSTISSTATGVSVTCADGTTYQGSVIVGADGVHSRVRRLMRGMALETTTTATTSSPTSNPEKPFLATYRVAFFTFRRPEKLTTLDIDQAYEVHAQGLTAQVLNSPSRSWVFMYEPLAEPTRDAVSYSEEDLMAAAEGWRDIPFCDFGITFGDIFDRRDSGGGGLTNMDEGVLPQWSRGGRVVLVGDAIRKMSPALAMGYNNGLQDVVAVTNELQRLLFRRPKETQQQGDNGSRHLRSSSSSGSIVPSAEDLDGAFKRYQDSRVKLSADATYYSGLATRLSSWHNRLYAFLEVWVLPHLPARLDRWLFAQITAPTFSQGFVLDGVEVEEPFRGSIPCPYPLKGPQK